MAKLRQFHLADPALFEVGHAPVAAERFFVGAGSPAHGHDYVEIGLTVQGQVTDFDCKGERTLRRGDGYVIRPGGWHGNRPCKKAYIYNCCIAPDLLSNPIGWARQDPHLDYLLFTGPAAAQNRGILRFRLDEPAVRDCENHLDELQRVRKHPQQYGWLDEVSRLCVFLAALARSVRRQFGIQDRSSNAPLDPRVSRALQILDANLATSLSLEQVARAVGLDRFRLVRQFREETGGTPLAYRMRRRVEQAASMLLRSDASIAQVGASLGWYDQNYFARRFKAQFGVSPSQYRERFYRSGGRPDRDSDR